MEEYTMENSDSIWQWCGAGKKLITISKIHSMADGFSSVAKGKQCIDDYPLGRYSPTSEGNPLKSSAYCGDMCLPVQDSIAEVREWRIEEGHNSSSASATNSDTVPDHPHGDSGSGGQLLHWPLGIADENSVDKNQQWKSRVGRKGQKVALKQNRLFSDEGMIGSSDQYAACNREPSVDASSSCSISKVLAEDMELQSRNMNRDMGNLRFVASRETRSNYNSWPCHPPASNKPKRNQSLVSENSKSTFEIEKQKAKSEILFPGLRLLADAAVRLLENDVVGSPESRLTEEKGIRKAIFIPTGVPFLQKRVSRIAKSAFKHRQPFARQMLYDLQKSPSAANSEPLLTADNVYKLGVPECIKQSGIKLWVMKIQCRSHMSAARRELGPRHCHQSIVTPFSSHGRKVLEDSSLISVLIE